MHECKNAITKGDWRFIMKKYLLIALSVLLVFLVGCVVPASEPEAEQESVSESAPGDASDSALKKPADSAPEPQEPQYEGPAPDTITGSIEMEDGGIITFELYPGLAPQTVQNFIYLARQGFYDGSSFHRIISGMMIQGGSPGGSGSGGPGYTIVGEFNANGFENNIDHTRGILSMARAQDFNSGGSQFFIMHDVYPSLDGQYAVFGMVTDGMDVVDKIAATPNSGPNGAVAPEDMPVIKTITINGNFYMPEPDKLG